MIDSQTIERIVEQADIVDIISDFITLRRRGVNYIACCPFHDEKTPSFVVSPSKNIFKCFGCGKAGNSITFVMEHERLAYIDAIKYVGKKYGIEIIEKEQTAGEIALNSDRESMMIVSSFANSFFYNTLHNTDEGRAVGMSYFKERGFSKQTVEKFQLGYSPAKRNALSEAAIKAGYKEEFLLKTGLSIKREDGSLCDRFAGRAIFPIHSLSGRVIAFGGRILQTDKKTAKYLNSPESDIYLKRNVLYGIFFSRQAISRLDKCYLVEGYTDVISMYAAGVENVVASSGTSLTEEQIKLISRFSKNVTVLFDGDAAGIKASLRGIDMLLKAGLKVRVVLLPDGEDPDSFAKTHNSTELHNFLETAEQDFLTFKVNLLNKNSSGDPLKKVEIIHEIVKSISVIPDLITRSVYIKECSKTLEIEENALAKEIAANRRKQPVSDNYSEKEQNLPATEKSEDNSENKKLEENPADKSTVATVFETNIICNEQEKELLMFMLKYGRTKLFVTGNKHGADVYICVDEYIIQDFKHDDISFKNIQFKRIFDEYEKLLTESPDREQSFYAQYFIRHDEIAISSLAINLLTDTNMQENESYFVSPIWNGTDNVHIDIAKAIPKALAVYKSKILAMDRSELVLRLKKTEEEPYHLDILKKIKLIDEQRKCISDFLDRVLV
ncbi:MAG: DNA primase [Prevotellaceae bacterium]|jgi:DNA primase|nr:DNA primase [Prevotellaceae bacterium]